ncbi:MAG: hypothetical protein ACLSB9_15875 [Hydrogeniiclostridium mannosilyticum]
MGALDTLKDINKRNWKHVLGQFIKFGLIGASNTLISTAIYYVFVWIDPKFYFLGNAVGWIISYLIAFIGITDLFLRIHSFMGEKTVSYVPCIWWWFCNWQYYLGGSSKCFRSFRVDCSMDKYDNYNSIEFLLNKFWAFKA